MKAEQVDQALHQKFVTEGERLVFWHDPNGEFVEYVPSVVEWVVSLGIWCFGLLVFSILVRLGVQIEHGALRAPGLPAAPVASQGSEEAKA